MDGSGEFDLIVIGAGIAGLSTALTARKSGIKSVLCIDQHGVANSFGASGDGLRLFRLSYYEHPGYVPLLRQAIDRWNSLAGDIYCPVGGFYAGPLGSELMFGSLESSNLHGIPHDILPAMTAEKQFPNFRLPSDYAVFTEQQGGYIRAKIGTEAVGNAATECGVELLNAKVIGLEPYGNRWNVLGEDFRCRADCVIVAAGIDTGELVPNVATYLKKETHLLLWLEDQENRFAQGPGFGIMNDSGEMLYGFPAVDDIPGVKIGGHHQFSFASLEGQENRLLELAAEFLPSLSGKVLARKSCHYDMSPDGHFIFGEVEPGLSVACGFSGHGFKFGPILGELAWQAAVGNLDKDLSFLSVSRLL
jgi:sarcosine oxidase